MNLVSAQFFDNQAVGLMIRETQLLDIKQLAQILNKPEGTIRDWVYKRKIKFLKVGNCIRFDPSDIQKWLRERSYENVD